VQKGFSLTYRRKTIPKPSELAKFGERWRPYRTVASWYMWRAIELAGKHARTITKKRIVAKQHTVKQTSAGRRQAKGTPTRAERTQAAPGTVRRASSPRFALDGQEERH
jgi:hypothetical protein